MMTDTQILDHLSAGSPIYLEMDEPDGTIQTDRDSGELVVRRRRWGTTHAYDEIHRTHNLREALDAAITMQIDKDFRPDNATEEE